jgi:hypothetical protein
LNTEISTCAVPSSSMTTIILPRRVIWVRAATTIPAIHTRSPGASLASGTRGKPAMLRS